MSVRPLNIILARIARRHRRVRNMREWGIDDVAIQLELDVIKSLTAEYTSRVNRLNLYMGLT